jgi:hypothetical protein
LLDADAEPDVPLPHADPDPNPDHADPEADLHVQVDPAADYASADYASHDHASDNRTASAGAEHDLRCAYRTGAPGVVERSRDGGPDRWRQHRWRRQHRRWWF